MKNPTKITITAISHLPQESIQAKAVRRTQSLRKMSERKNAGQPGHPGSTLKTSTTPDVIRNINLIIVNIVAHHWKEPHLFV